MRTFQVSDVENEYSPQNYIGFRVVTIIGALIIFSIYSIAVSPNFETLLCMLIFLVFKSDESFVNVLYGINQKASRMDYIGISQGIRGLLSIYAFSFALLWTQSLAISLTAMLLSCVLATLFFDIPFSGRLEDIRLRLNRSVLNRLLVKCAPIVAALIIYGLVATFARQYYGIMYGEEDLGIYAAVATPCVLVQVLANYLYSPFLVPLSERWKNDGKQAFTKLLLKILGALLFVSLFCILCAMFLGQWILETIYGTTITEYAWMITPAVIAAGLMAICYFLTDLFTLLRKFKFALSINIVALVVCIALIAPLTHQFGMNGVNITLILSFASAMTLGLFFLIRLLGISSRHWLTKQYIA